MRRKHLPFLSMLAAAGIVMASASGTAAQQAVRDKRPVVTGASITFGAYDPHGDFRNDPSSSIEHIFVPWQDLDPATLDAADQYAMGQKRSLLITIEPWSWHARSQYSSNELYSGIMAGRFDANMAGICQKTANMRSPVVIRWGQEMDDNNGQFIWSSWTPEQFINAYRHVVDVCRKQDKSARFMWSVQGDRTVSSYYPGDNYVDIVGVTLFGLQKRDKDEVGRDRSFEDMLQPIYQRVAQFNKPVYVAEFGYEGDDNYVREWARAVSRPYYNMPLLKGVIYFNDREVYPWFNNYGLPNWRVVQDMASGK